MGAQHAAYGQIPPPRIAQDKLLRARDATARRAPWAHGDEHEGLPCPTVRVQSVLLFASACVQQVTDKRLGRDTYAYPRT